MRNIMIIFVLITLSGCVSSNQWKGAGKLKVIAPNAELMLSSKGKHNELLDEIDAAYVNIGYDLKTAMLFATFRQREDYFRKKNVGLLGVLFGLTATTLNTASAANIVISTAFTGLQTASLGYISTDEDLVDPYSNSQITLTKIELEKLHSDYSKLRGELNNYSLEDWDKKYSEAYALLSSINFKCFSILPPG